MTYVQDTFRKKMEPLQFGQNDAYKPALRRAAPRF
jgi:hypothetical protein